MEVQKPMLKKTYLLTSSEEATPRRKCDIKEDLRPSP